MDTPSPAIPNQQPPTTPHKNNVGLIVGMIVLLMIVAISSYMLGKMSNPGSTLLPQPPVDIVEPTTVTTPISDEEAVTEVAREYLNNIDGPKKTVNSARLISTDLYTVSYMAEDTPQPSEPPYVLVGKVGNKWTVAIHYDENYCKWVSESDIDEATKAFLGYEHCR